MGNLFRLNGGIVKQSNKLQNHSTLKLPCKKSPIGDSLSHLQNHTTLKPQIRVRDSKARPVTTKCDSINAVISNKSHHLKYTH